MNLPSESVKTRNRNRVTLLAIIAVFLVPFALAWALALGPLEWRPQHTLNHGVLLQPPLLLSSYGIHNIQGGQLSLDARAGDWFLVVMHGASCAAACRDLAGTANRIRLAVGRDSQRVSIVSLGPEPASPALPDGNWVLPADQDLMPDLRRATGEPELSDALLIVDYQGSVVLAYPSVEDEYDPLRDLERLLSMVPE